MDTVDDQLAVRDPAPDRTLRNVETFGDGFDRVVLLETAAITRPTTGEPENGHFLPWAPGRITCPHLRLCSKKFSEHPGRVLPCGWRVRLELTGFQFFLRGYE